ncbi:MAG: DNA polymerase I [Saprospiraceae bacterium]|nr:DNA polymerase I [Candidatus Vicinibacter affinis]MBK7797623.1 DNA polymerase I [Candidatus Vicinibacter affinis]MBK9642141.1 DNA polymerase I [Candidatus Vicinibacter affinis]
MKKLFLLDGHALVYRAHYAFIGRPLINSKGLNTSAISGFTRTLWDIINNEKPSHIAVAFDLHGPTFRHEEFPAYKANREAQPEDISIALPYIEEIVKAFNIPIVTAESYEADDVIGTLAKQAAGEGFDVFMVTPDKDYGQLVEDHIFMYKPSRQGNGVDILGPKQIVESWGLNRVDQVIDLLGLMGDAVDNIPGIPGVGEKTAVKLLQEFDTVENLIAHKDQVSGKLKDKITEFADQALLSKKLATISLDAPVQFEEKAYRIEGANKEKLAELFRELEFRSLAQSVLGGHSSTASNLLFGVEEKIEKTPLPLTEYKVSDHDIYNTPHEYHLVLEEKDLLQLFDKLQNSKIISFDTETTGIDATAAELVGMSFAFKPKEAYYVPVDRDQKKAQQLVDKFKPFLEDVHKKFVGQNIKYDMLMMLQYGVNMPRPYFDTMIAHYLIEPDLRHKLDFLSEAYLNYKMVGIEELIGKKSPEQGSMRDVPLEKIKEYAAEDADITLQLQPILEKEIINFEVNDVLQNIELPLVKVLCDIEHAGVRVDADFLNNYSKVLGKQIEITENEIYSKAGVRFNIASPKQVGEVLFDRLKIPYKWKKTSTNQYSTDEEKLNELADENEVVKTILEHRKLSKLKSTYVDALPLMINQKTGRVHSSFNQARAATGRLASENPNLQNIPIKDEAGREIRKAFIPRDENHLIFSADYSQIELRLIADISNEEAMMEAFIKEQDIHRATAAKVYGIPYEAVTSDQRRNAKTVNFSILYGAGSTNISRQLGISRTEAKELIDQYFNTYTGLKKYMSGVVEAARSDGFVKTLLGRKRVLRDINSKNALARTNSERVAVNTPIQGTAADLIKLAMIKIHDRLLKENLQTKMILQVHDELVFDVLKTELKQVQEMVVYEMKNAIPGLRVPLEVGLGSGNNWLEAH